MNIYIEQFKDGLCNIRSLNIKTIFKVETDLIWTKWIKWDWHQTETRIKQSILIHLARMNESSFRVSNCVEVFQVSCIMLRATHPF